MIWIVINSLFYPEKSVINDVKSITNVFGHKVAYEYVECTFDNYILVTKRNTTLEYVNVQLLL